jgi:hypothetical protein
MRGCLRLKVIEHSPVKIMFESMPEYERSQGEQFDFSHINIRVSRNGEQRAWPSKAANFLKHADQDPEGHLAAHEVDNERVLVGACIAHQKLMGMSTPRDHGIPCVPGGEE